ncbi:uncharacterized protein FFUJ_03878 [Fusarium fujikuroi IMI 58289]|uniref:Uncharacterized protein n=1 Tax=Gibberella fujikuroi (strain CBS 195.34 / IMI 58289 / NRRL A-6831) TaxID=1279085 RepID=S0DTY5_GIBF5|nr:uncharacterized protein FFUJ_03878 [Fusarium fujikuroi IMI 58289]SCN89791.1 uncharacterized protein FFM5_04802 [Fusarium fujikuroi]CCT64862.1 uncharacterized protein FFUJ_03878 [Fusarium fujikuroi IMI 58289]SCO03407.1 uncharacterized protein FFC1_09308 [Fusarium fujikuroi]SCO35570.1 uncharacterized protein FFNC_04586 [Fusarium fujikuroi]SCO36364.1 uncharacterized protein FFMR_04049 [Fusarium fujikuroi]
MISTPEPPSSRQTETVEPLLDPGLMMNQNELKVWNALCELEDELEVGWLPICKDSINLDDGSAKRQEERLGLINGIHSNIIKKLRRIEQLSGPDIKAKRSHVEEKVDKLLATFGAKSMTGTEKYWIL